MYVIELVLRNVAMPVSVQRKEAADAEKLYQEVLAAVKANQSGHLIELTCEQQTEKKSAVWVSDVAAVQTYSKSGAPASGRATGFASALGQ
jgi:hypothetical protein